jgi:GntR family transcriptional regulator
MATKYQQIVNAVLYGIERGDHPPGKLLASQREMMANFKVSRATVIKALDVLDRMDVIERRPGSGTYVKEPSNTMKSKIGKAEEEKA